MQQSSLLVETPGPVDPSDLASFMEAEVCGGCMPEICPSLSTGLHWIPSMKSSKLFNLVHEVVQSPPVVMRTHDLHVWVARNCCWTVYNE